MALAFGVASGLGPVAGISGAIFVGFFAAIFGGTPSQVSGPTGPMAIAMASVVVIYSDDLATAFAIVMLAGLLQVALGALRMGTFVSYTPYSVISGFMSGIGIIIIALQFHPNLGVEAITGSIVEQLRDLPGALAAMHLDAVIVGTLAFGICIFCRGTCISSCRLPWPP